MFNFDQRCAAQSQIVYRKDNQVLIDILLRRPVEH